MKNKKIWLVMVLVFGMTVVGCDTGGGGGGGGNGNGDTNRINTLGLTPGRPADAAFDSLIVAAGGNPVGYIPGGSPGSVEHVVWTGRSPAQFNAIVAWVDSSPLPVTLDGPPTYANGVWTAYFSGYRLVTFIPARISGPRPDLQLPAGYFFPAGAIILRLG